MKITKKTTFVFIAILVLVTGLYFYSKNINYSSPLPNEYKNTLKGFSIRYSYGFTVDDKYTYQEFGPGKEISGVKFIIPPTVASGTNLSEDSYISVEQILDAKICTADLFLDTNSPVKSIIEKDVSYSVASSTGAAAGNRYEETVYAILKSNPCTAVRYFIHYGVIENYSVDTVREFDKKMLIDEFNTIRSTLIITN